MAINESKKEAERISALEKAPPKMVSGSTLSQSAIDDLLSLGVGQPVNAAQNPWGGPTVDPWAPSPSVTSPVPPSATIGKTTVKCCFVELFQILYTTGYSNFYHFRLKNKLLSHLWYCINTS